MAANDIRNVAFDGSTGHMRWGARAVPCTNIDFPEESIKTEKIRLIGDQIATIRTVGVYDADEAGIEVLDSTWSGIILPSLPINGINLFEFTITITQRHPLVAGPYSAVLDRCRITGIGGTISNDEKGTKRKLKISVIQVFHKGADGKFKSLAYKPQEPSPTTAQFLF